MNSLRQVELSESVAVEHGSFSEPVVERPPDGRSDSPDLLGGRYALGSRVRTDAEGVTYEADDRFADRAVEVTVFDPGLSDDRVAIGQIEAEVTLAARLTHPNIVRTLDWGTDADRSYRVRESIPGRTLAEVMTSDGQLPASRAARIGADVAAALAAAHRCGAAHGRLDTNAIIVTTAGLVKVAGFGSDRVDGPAARRSDLAQLGSVLRAMVGADEPVPADEPEVLDALYVDDARSGHLPGAPALSAIIDRLAATDQRLGYPSAEAAEADLRGYRDTTAGAGGVGATPNRAVVAPIGAGAPGPARAPWGNGPPVPPVEEPDDVTSSPLFLVGLAGLLLVMIAVAVYLSNAISGSETAATGTIAVPTVMGDASDVAVERLVTAGFEVEEEMVETDAHDPGTVFAQDPPARTEMLPGETITISIALPPSTVVVPDVVELTRTEAVDELSALGLDVQLRRESSEVVELDRVISQSLRPGEEVGEGADIEVVVSTGPERVPVPELAGLPVAQATVLLDEQNLENVRWEYEPSGEVPQDTIVRTEPAAGSQIELTAPITVFVSTGNNNFVPGVVGLDRGEAERLLRDSGFRPQVDSVTVDGDSGLVGYVIAQGPDTGSLQPLGSTVWIQVGQEDKSLIDRLLGGGDDDDNDRRGNRRRGRGNDRDDD